MKKEKFYFIKEFTEGFDEGFAYAKSYIIDMMKERKLLEIEVYEAIRELKSNNFFCKAFYENGMKGADYEPCGKKCEAYEARNGKNGCCKHRGFCYEPGEKFILKINGKLLK